VNTMTSRALVQVHLCAAAVLIAVIGCGDMTDEQAPSAPDLASAAAALSFIQVSGGDRFSCGVTTDNRVYCWGENDSGQLGDGTQTKESRPVPVAGTLRFRQISAGYHHTCGVTTTNQAYCWGQGVDGELGDGAAVDRSTPVLVGNGRLFRQVDAGQYHTCGVSYPDNKAYCWGYNGSFALGDGTSTSHPSPVAVKGGHLFHQVTAGGVFGHSCGVTTSDQAFCWGWNDKGQLGDGSKVPRSTPVAVAGTRQFDQIEAGDTHTCAVTTGDRAFCWGNNRDGQMGDGTVKISSVPRAVAGGLGFTRVSTGRLHSCGETTGNRAYCWGNNVDGQLGDGTTTSPRLTPVAVAGGRSFVQVSTGGAHSCGVTAGSAAFCWGPNDMGQIGDGTNTPRPAPVRVLGPS
jgi:alpha-tubulin suppressor-like RCC1 family protein